MKTWMPGIKPGMTVESLCLSCVMAGLIPVIHISGP